VLELIPPCLLLLLSPADNAKDDSYDWVIRKRKLIRKAFFHVGYNDSRCNLGFAAVVQSHSSSTTIFFVPHMKGSDFLYKALFIFIFMRSDLAMILISI
jgi:hypothetical protein